MLKKSQSSGLFSATSRKNKYLVLTPIKSNITQNDFLSKNKKRMNNNIIKLYKPFRSANIYGKNNTNYYNNKKAGLKSAQIYLRLEKSEEIAKIINEEEKKRYFNREFHLSKTVNRDELKRRMGNITPAYRTKIKIKKIEKNKFNTVENKDRRKFSISNNYGIKSLININNRLIHNYKYQGENEILKSKLNYDAVTNFLKSMDEEKKKLYDDMEKQFLENKKKNPFDEENVINNEENKEIDNNKKIKKKNKKKQEQIIKLKEADFIKFKKKMLIKESRLFKEKSRIFDNILNYDFKTYITSKDEEEKHQNVNYRLLSRTILMRNLMKQMKVAVYKDEALNALRGFQALKIESINNGSFKNQNQDSYSNQSNNDFFYFSGSLKDKPIPHFLKLKFNMNTTKKFGEINGSYFGLPV
jgi:hypothetical protein